jgi:hypothetical protein
MIYVRLLTNAVIKFPDWADEVDVSRLRPLLALVLVAIAVSAAPARADLVNLSCPGATSQPFLRYLDPFYYRLADGGDVGADAVGWTLSGAKSLLSTLAPGLAGTGDDHVLGLPAGSTATSPSTCVSLLSPTMRFMVRSTGSPLGILLVTAVVTNGNGLIKTIPMGVVTGLGSSWKPSLPMVLATTLLGTLGSDTAQVSFRFTTPGLGGSFQVDDVYVDPYRKG